MYSLLFLGFVSFALALGLTPLVRNVCLRRGIVDRPDGGRKGHQQPVPHVGGVAVLLACLGAFGLLMLTDWEGASAVEQALPFARHLLPAVALIFLTGLLDDLKGLEPWHKLLGQFAAAGSAFWAGVRVEGFAGHEFAEWWSLPLTVAWLMVCMNAVNLIDGVDGLAAGVGIFAATTTLLAAILQGNFGLAAATVPLVGALLGFLRYNFNPATIFLGDSGSLLIGFLLGCFGVLWSQKAATLLGMTAPVMALSVPLIDAGVAVARRILRRQSVFSADRNHIHHRLLDRGLTPRRVALVFYALCGLAAAFSLVMSSRQFANQQSGALILVVFAVVAGVGVQQLGYLEFRVALRMFAEGAFLHMVSSRITLENHERTLASATTPGECWDVIERVAREVGLQRARLELGGQSFEYARDNRALHAWNVHLPFSEADYLDLSIAYGGFGHAAIVAPFAEMLHRIIGAKAGTFAGPAPSMVAAVATSQGD